MRSWIVIFAALLWLSGSPAGADELSYLNYYTYYKVKPGETLETIAAAQGLHPNVLRKMNPKLEGKDVQELGVLCVPAERPDAESEEPATKDPSEAKVEPKEEQAKDAEPEELSPGDLAYLTSYGQGFISQSGDSITIQGRPQHRNTFVGSDGRVVSVPTTVPRRAYRQLSSRRGKSLHSVLATARKFMGVPYVWGGESASGVDCSGFVMRVFAMHGVRLPRTADVQYQVGLRVPRGKEQPGDLVFFETYLPGPSHVGIFIGDGHFIHASSSRGVTVDSLSTAFYRERYLGAKRVL